MPDRLFVLFSDGKNEGDWMVRGIDAAWKQVGAAAKLIGETGHPAG